MNKYIIYFLILLIVIICASIINMNKFIFLPPKTLSSSFQSLNTSYSKLISIKGINCVLINPQQKAKDSKIIIFSHGNGCDIYTMFDYCKKLSNKLNVYVLLYDYYGYGLSAKTPSEQGCYDSLSNVVDYSLQSFSKKDIIFMGQSLGTGVVIDYAVKTNWISPIILISPYKSILSILTDFSLLSLFDKFISINKIDKLKCPVKIFHGQNDTLINMSHSQLLFNKIKNKEFEPTYIPNTGHNDILNKINLEEIQLVLDTFIF